MKEHYYSNFKGCLGTRTHLDSLDGSLASISRTPFRSTFSLSFTLSLSLFFQRNPFRGAHQNRLNFELALARLLLSRCHFISTRSTVENVLRTYTQYPPPLDIANYSAFISSLSFLLSSNSRVVERSSPGSRWR